MNSRQSFEAYILRTTPTAELDTNNGEYVVQAIQYQWIGWQACRKELSEREPVAYLDKDCCKWRAETSMDKDRWGMRPLIIRPTEE